MTIIIIYSGTFICLFQLYNFSYGLNSYFILHYFTFDLSVPIRTGLELWDDSYGENIRIPIFVMSELSLNVIFPTYGTSDTGRVIIKAHIGVCGRAYNPKYSRSRKRDVVWLEINSRCI